MSFLENNNSSSQKNDNEGAFTLKLSKPQIPQGEIKYVLLVASLPTEPSQEHMVVFLQETLPEIEKSVNAKIGLVWRTDPIDSIDIPALAVQAFGTDASNENKYIYRTIGVKLQQGYAKILVIYDK